MNSKLTPTVALLVAIAVAMHGPMAGLKYWAVVVYAACLGIALTRRLDWAMHTALFTTLSASYLAVPLLYPSLGRLPVLPLLIPLLVSSAMIAAKPATRMTLEWLHWGRASTGLWVLVGATGLGSAVALVLWAVWTDNLGIGVKMMESVAHLPRLTVIFGLIPAFAFLNAITEEAVFRGVLFTALARSSGSTWFANTVQASAFAAIHYEMGFPNGAIGYSMTFVYALVLGYLRARTDGLLAPVVAHIVADLVIGYIVLFGPPTM